MILGIADGFRDFIANAEHAAESIKAIFELFLSIVEMVINFFPSPFKEILLLFSAVFGGVIIFKIVGDFL